LVGGVRANHPRETAEDENDDDDDDDEEDSDDQAIPRHFVPGYYQLVPPGQRP
jgi:hypothetical protein